MLIYYRNRQMATKVFIRGAFTSKLQTCETEAPQCRTTARGGRSCVRWPSTETKCIVAVSEREPVVGGSFRSFSLKKTKFPICYPLSFIHITTFITLTLLPIMEIKELKNNERIEQNTSSSIYKPGEIWSKSWPLQTIHKYTALERKAYENSKTQPTKVGFWD